MVIHHPMLENEQEPKYEIRDLTDDLIECFIQEQLKAIVKWQFCCLEDHKIDGPKIDTTRTHCDAAIIDLKRSYISRLVREYILHLLIQLAYAAEIDVIANHSVRANAIETNQSVLVWLCSAV